MNAFAPDSQTRYGGRRLLSTTVLGCCALVAACAGSAVEPAPQTPTGAIRIVNLTVGRNLDPDGYLVTVGSAAAESVGANDTVIVSNLPVGIQSIAVSGIAANCRNYPETPFDAVVTEASTRDVSIEIECLAMSTDVTLAFERRDGIHPVVHLAGMRASTGEVEQLTFHAGVDLAPDWSPDGSRLAWSRDGRIHVVNMDGTGFRSFGERGVGTNPDWSPDGTRIAYDDGANIIVFEVDGTGETVIGTGIQPAWSPDGTKIAVEVEGATAFESDIVIMNADGTDAVNITQMPVLVDREPAWSPDGSRIAFRRLNRLGSTGYDLWVIDADGANATRLLDLAGPQLNPSWLPDNRILFDHDRAIWVIDLDAGGAAAELVGEAGFFHNDAAPRD